MSKLDEYSKISELRKEKYKECTRSIGPLSIGPTNKGGIYMSLNDKQLFTDISIKDLKLFRDLITDFLINIVGEE